MSESASYPSEQEKKNVVMKRNVKCKEKCKKKDLG